MSHPHTRDYFRHVLAKNSIWKLIGYYLLLLLLVSLTLALLLKYSGPTGMVYESPESKNNQQGFISWWWYSFSSCNGFAPAREFELTNMRRAVIVMMAIIQILFPSLFLAAIVFKFLMPSRDILYYHNKLALCRHEGRLHIQVLCYISSRLVVEDLSFEAHVRAIYKNEPFPLRTDPIKCAHSPKFPKPYNACPTSAIRIPVGISVKPDHEHLIPALANADDQRELPFVFRRTADGLELVKIFGREGFEPNSVELIVIAKGRIPKLDMDFYESYEFGIDAFVDGWIPSWELGKVDKERNRLEVNNWEDFGNEISVAQHAEVAFKKIAGEINEQLNATRNVPEQIGEIESREQDGLIREQLKLKVEPGDKDNLDVTILRPNTSDRVPGLICLHQTTKDKSLGSAEVLGDGGDKNFAYGKELAQRGYVVATTNYPGFGGYDPDWKGLGYKSIGMKGLWNHIRLLDYLESRNDITDGTFGAVGHSLGAHNALFMACFDQRIQAVLASAGFTSFQKYRQQENGIPDLTIWAREEKYFPMIETVFGKDAKEMPFDFDDLSGAIAPRPVYLNAPRNDEEFSFAGVVDLIPSIISFYEKHDAMKNLRIDAPNCDHTWPDKERQNAYEFLDAHFKAGFDSKKS